MNIRQDAPACIKEILLNLGDDLLQDLLEGLSDAILDDIEIEIDSILDSANSALDKLEDGLRIEILVDKLSSALDVFDAIPCSQASQAKSTLNSYLNNVLLENQAYKNISSLRTYINTAEQYKANLLNTRELNRIGKESLEKWLE